MQILLILTMTLLATTNPQLKIDFGKYSSGENWRVLSDNVMGGLSNGQIEIGENILQFRGEISLENNGGFSSIRSSWGNRDLSQFKKVKIRYRNKGQSFALTLEEDRRWFMPYFKKEFTTESEDWQEVTLDLSVFNEYRIGRKTGNFITKENLSQIIRIGIVTNDKNASEFELELDYIIFE